MVPGSETGDLNRGASNTYYLYLWYNKLPECGKGYTDLDIIYGKGAVVPAGWHLMGKDEKSTAGGDLNKSTSGYAYLVARPAPA